MIAGYIRVSDQKLNTDGLRLQDIKSFKIMITKHNMEYYKEN